MEIFDSGLIEKIIRNDSMGKASETSANCPEPDGVFPPEMPVGMCYVPMQKWGKPYDVIVGLNRGTIFPELDKPFIGEEAVRSGKR